MLTEDSLKTHGVLTAKRKEKNRKEKKEKKNRKGKGKGIEIESEVKESQSPPYDDIVDLYHQVCLSFPKIIKLTDTRKKTLKARYEEYGRDIAIFKQLFLCAEKSDFLKGNNDRKWKANFDWLINSSNMIKVLEGRYGNVEVINESKEEEKSSETRWQ